MAKNKYTDRICLIVILVMLAVTLLFCFGESLGLTAVDRRSLSSGPHYEAGIRFSGTEVEIKGSGVYHTGGVITIGCAGEYTLGGTLTEGQIIVDAGSADTVTLILDGAEITCAEGAALWVKNAGCVTVRTIKGTENALRCGERFSAGAEAAGVSGALHAEDDLVLEGEGTLRVEGACRHGIVGKDDVTVRSGSILVNAAEDGIRGRDKLVIEDGILDITAGGDALRSGNDLDEGKGNIRIKGGSFTLTSEGDAVQAAGDITVSGGTFDISAGGDALQAERSLTVENGSFTILSGGGAAAFPGKGEDAADRVSAKGLKAASITLNGGVFALDCADDALHASDTLTVNGGTLVITTGDDALHADNTLFIADGTITAAECQEGLEANLITVSGGSIDIFSYNDGVNASSGTNWAKLYGAGQGAAAAEELSVYRQTGGAVRICAYDDGVDSNGDIRIEGGSLLVSAEAAGHSKALDCGRENGGVCLVSGGTVIACGYFDTAENFDYDSSQCSALFHTEEAMRAGTEFVLTDENGSRLMSFVPENAYNAVLFSAPAMKAGQRCTVSVGGHPTVIELAGLCGVYGEKRSPNFDD